jgi:hypothetical protein
MDQQSFDLNNDEQRERFQALPKEQQQDLMQLMANLITTVFKSSKEDDHGDT